METIWSCAALNMAFCLTCDLLQRQEQLLRRSFAFAACCWKTSLHYSVLFFPRKCKRHSACQPYTSDIIDMKLTRKVRKFVFGCHLRVRDQAGRRCQACAALCSFLDTQPRLQFVKQMKCVVASTSRFFGLQLSDPPDKSRWQNKPFGIGWENLMSFFFPSAQPSNWDLLVNTRMHVPYKGGSV